MSDTTNASIWPGNGAGTTSKPVSSTLRQQAVELNNCGVTCHRKYSLDAAAACYRSALRTLKGSAGAQLEALVRTGGEIPNLTNKPIFAPVREIGETVESDEGNRMLQPEAHEGSTDNCTSESGPQEQSGTCTMHPVPITAQDVSLGRNEEAVTVVVIYNMAMLSLEESKWEKAAYLLRTALQVAPMSDAAMKDDTSLAFLYLSIHFHLGVLHTKMGLFHQSNENFRTAIEIGMASEGISFSRLFANVLQGMGNVLFDRGMLRDAWELFETAAVIRAKLERDAMEVKDDMETVPHCAAAA